MSTSLKRCFQKGRSHFESHIKGHKSGGDRQQVCIVVATAKHCQFFIPANGGPYSLVFIGRHRHSVTTSTNNQASAYSSCLNRFAEWVDKIGIIHRCIRIGTEVLHRSEEHTSELQSRPHLVCR